MPSTAWNCVGERTAVTVRLPWKRTGWALRTKKVSPTFRPLGKDVVYVSVARCRPGRSTTSQSSLSIYHES